MPEKRFAVDDLLARATAGRTPDEKPIFRPSMAYKVIEDPHALWCDCHAPRSEAVEEDSRFDALCRRWGEEFEDRWIRDNHADATVVEARGGLQALRSTLKAMLDGARALRAPQLWALGDECYGKGDLIVRCDDAPSDLGALHYRVVEIKRSRTVEQHHAVQAALYNRMVGRIQGYRPPSIKIVNLEGCKEIAAEEIEKECDRILSEWRSIRDGKTTPELPAFDDAKSPWRVYTNKILEQRRDLTLVPGVSGRERGKLRERLRASKVEDLEGLAEADLQRALGPVMGSRVYYGRMAMKAGSAVVRAGVELAIARRPRRLYLDFETSDPRHPTIPPHVYMIGVCDQEGRNYRVFTAHGAEEEQKVFEDFSRLIGDAQDACLYHWDHAETTHMRAAIKRHPSLEVPLNALIDSCVDLKKAICAKVSFPTPTNSIKDVAPLFKFDWRQESVDAMESMVLYWEWLVDGDKTKIQRVVTYNEDDCIAMARVDEAVQRLCAV